MPVPRSRRRLVRALAAVCLFGGAPGFAASAPLTPEAVDPEWFLARLDPSAEVAEAMRAASDPATSLAVLDDRLLAAPARGVPLGLASHGGALESFLADRTVRIRRYPARSLVPPIDWRTGPDETFLAELHSWRYLTPWLEAYRRDGDAELLRAAEAVVRDWWQANGTARSAPPRAWHEGSVVKRTLVLVNWLGVLADRRADSTLLPHELAWLLHRHVQTLLAPGQYRGPGNHEVRQDLALILASFALRDLAEAESWRRLAIERLVSVQIGRGFSEEGVWLEHSPAYHGYVMLLFLRVRDALTGNGAPLPEPLVALLVASDRYLAGILTPAGLYPPLGDSQEGRPPAELVARSAEVTFAASRGSRGTAPSTVDAFFPHAGQAVLEDPASAPEHARRLWVLVHAGQHLPMGHRHEDALSIVAHFDGRWWLREGGRFGYRSGAERDFVLGPSAHNGHRWIGGALRPTERPHLTAGLAPEVVSEPAIAAVRAFSERFPAAGARAERITALLRGENVVLVADRLTAPVAGWESTFNLAPDFEVVAASPGILTVAPTSQPAGDWLLDVHLDPAGTDTVAMVRGAVEPLLGWVSPRDLELVAAPVIVLRNPASRLQRSTLFHWRRRDEPPLAEVRVEGGDEAMLVSWQRRGERIEVEARFSGRPAHSRREALVPASSGPM